MIEHTRGIEEDFEEDNSQGRWTEKDDSNHLNPHRKEDLDGMESNPGSDIEIEVGMVDPVKPPEQRDEMEHGVLKVDDEIED